MTPGQFWLRPVLTPGYFECPACQPYKMPWCDIASPAASVVPTWRDITSPVVSGLTSVAQCDKQLLSCEETGLLSPAPSFSMLRQVCYEKIYLPTSTNLLMSLVRSIFTFSLLLKSTPRNHDECGLSLYSGSWQLKVTGFMCTVFIAGLCSRLEIKCRIFDSTSPYHSKWSSGVRATAITTR